MDNEHQGALLLAAQEMREILRSALKHIPTDLVAELAFGFEGLAKTAIRTVCEAAITELERRESSETGREDLFEYS